MTDTVQSAPVTEKQVITHRVDPARLAWGIYDHEKQRDIGEGDIQASYSADLIPSGKIRRPFTFENAMWVCVGSSSLHGISEASAYRLMPESSFPGPLTTYAAKTRDGDEARADPNGFYHGMKVQFSRAAFALCGPPEVFVADPDRPASTPDAQLSLFDP